MKKPYNGLIMNNCYQLIAVMKIPTTRKWGIWNTQELQWMFHNGVNAWHTMSEANLCAKEIVEKHQIAQQGQDCPAEQKHPLPEIPRELQSLESDSVLKLADDLGITTQYFAVEYYALIKGHEKKFGRGSGEIEKEAIVDLVSRIILMLKCPMGGGSHENLTKAVNELRKDE